MHSKHLMEYDCPKVVYKQSTKGMHLPCHRAESHIFLFSIVIERYKNNAAKLKCFHFLRCNSERYILEVFVKF